MRRGATPGFRGSVRQSEPGPGHTALPRKLRTLRLPGEARAEDLQPARRCDAWPPRPVDRSNRNDGHARLVFVQSARTAGQSVRTAGQFAQTVDLIPET